MNKILNCLANKVMCTAVVALGAFAAGAESVLTTNALYDAVNTDVSVGYQVSGLEGDEIAVVFTNDACEVINWKVPARLNDVQFLVVGGGGGGGSGGDTGESDNYHGVAGGGGGGVVTGSIFRLTKNWNVSVIVGKGGDGGIAKGTSIDEVSSEETVAAKNGGDSKFLVNETLYVKAPGGGGANKKTGGQGGSNSGSRTSTSVAIWDSSLFYTNSTYITSSIFGNPGGKANSTAPASAGGGGGALEAGHNGVSDPSRKAGDGGEGLRTSITGDSAVYGSGGGGGQSYYQGTRTQGFGGEGAGDGGRCGNSTAYNASNHTIASNALPNQGGGGGGGFRRSRDGAKTFIISNGGNGGSGIVVFRYKDPFKSGFKVIVR